MIRCAKVAGFALLVTLSFLPARLHGEENVDPVDRFTANARVAFMICKLKANKAIILDSWGEVSTCTNEMTASIKEDYQKATKKLAGNAAATKALKNFFAYWSASMSGIFPTTGESKSHWESRMANREQGLADKQSKVNVER